MTSLQALQDRFGRNVVFQMNVRLLDGGDKLGAVIATTIGAGAHIGQVNLGKVLTDSMVYELHVFAESDEQMASATAAVKAIEDVEVIEVLDRAMESHRGGSCEMRSRVPITSNTDLRIVYTPGVARVCKAIEADPAKAREFTGIANKVAIVTDGTAILGLGDIGPLAGMPVMEGKSAIFWEFARVSAEPILIDTRDPKEFINVCERIAGTFGAIQVEDVAAPQCFEITRTLDERLGIPVFHDDQHGTATIVLAGLYSALRRTGKRMEDMTCAIAGAGAAGTAIADLLMHAGVPDVVLTDSRGIVHRDRTDGMNAEKQALAERTNPQSVSGDLATAMAGRELFIGVARPNLVSQEMVRSMAADPLVFALANPVSEISVEHAYQAGASVAADGRMMNNALAYPGIFRGALDAAATSITIDMMMAAAEALSNIVPKGELLPEMMNPATHQAVAAAVKSAAKA